MKKLYQVTVIKPVTDYLRAFVEIEADSPEEAEELALDMDLDEELQFWQCGDCLESKTAEAVEIEREPSDYGFKAEGGAP